jgi:hypothetical protein
MFSVFLYLCFPCFLSLAFYQFFFPNFIFPVLLIFCVVSLRMFISYYIIKFYLLVILVVSRAGQVFMLNNEELH